MTWNLRKLASILLTVAITSLFCIGLYTYNNKYTHSYRHDNVTFSKEDFSSTHYLIYNWEFYPDVLLTPDELSDPSIQAQKIYTSIGERTRFDGLGTRDNPYGCGTYSLTLSLPPESRLYALELPEIFSAYRLYINGEEYMNIGNTDPDNYDAKTQIRLINFRANGSAQLVIAVSNYSHFYSGLVYPPCLGTPTSILSLRDTRQAILLVAITLELLLVVITFYLGFIMKQANALLFSLLSLTSCLTISFPLFHELIALPIHPWYTFEIVGIYLTPLLILLLHNRLCEIPKRYQAVSFSIMLIFFAIAVGYAMNSDSLTVPVMLLFSKCMSLYKFGIAAYIIFTSYWAINAGIEMSKPIYYASIAYAAIFLWDRLLPTFEPIFFGWYMDWANLVLIISIGISILGNISSAYRRNLAFAEEHRQMKKQLTMQNEYTRLLSEQSEKHRRMMHDFRQHLHTISVMSERIHATDETKELHKELRTYLERVSEHTVSSPKNTLKPFSSNPTVDALLQYYYNYATQKHISVEFYLVSSHLRLTDVEFCTLLGNLLENAVDACLRLPESTPKHIRLNSKETEHLLFLRIDNTYDGMILMENQSFLTRKTDQGIHGIGMESVREIVERYDGTIDIYPKANLFCVGISLPIQKK